MIQFFMQTITSKHTVPSKYLASANFARMKISIKISPEYDIDTWSLIEFLLKVEFPQLWNFGFAQNYWTFWFKFG